MPVGQRGRKQIFCPFQGNFVHFGFLLKPRITFPLLMPENLQCLQNFPQALQKILQALRIFPESILHSSAM